MANKQPSTPKFTVTLTPGAVALEWPAQPADGYRVYIAQPGAAYQLATTAAKGATSVTFPAPAHQFYVRVFADLAGVPSQTLSEGPFTPIPAAHAAPAPVAPVAAAPAPVAAPAPAVAPAPSSFKPSIKIVSAGTMAPAQVHVDLTGLYPAPTAADDVPEVSTNFGDPDGQFNIVPGPFSASHLYAKPGTYTISANGTTATVEIAPDTRKDVYVSAAGNDLVGLGTLAAPYSTVAKALKSYPSNAWIMLRGGDTFTWSTPNTVLLQNVVIGSYGNGQPTIKYNGPRSGSPSAFAPPPGSEQVVFQNIIFDSIYSAHNATVQGDTDYANCNAILAGGVTGLTAWNCDFRNIDYGVTFNSGAAALILGCTALQVHTSGAVLPLHTDDTSSPNITGLRGNAVYGGGGNYLAVYGLNVANSTREHNVRIDGTNFVSVIGSDLTNLSRAAIDKSDIAKSTILFHCGSHLYAGGNTLRFGPPGVGPLNRADLAAAAAGTEDHQEYLAELGHSAEWAIFENNTILQAPLEVQPGAAHVMIRANKITANGSDAVLVNGYDGNYKRLAGDVVIDGNAATNTATTTGRMLNLSAPNPTTTPLPAGQQLADGLRIRRNKYVAPALAFDKGTGAAGVFVQESGLQSFSEIDANTYSANVQNYVGAGQAILKNNYHASAAWNAMSPVKGDTFA